MSVGPGDILEYQSTAAGSTGGAISGSSITSGITNNVWPQITDAQRLAGIVLYRKTFWKNLHATDPAVKPVIWASAPPTNASLLIGFGINDANDSDSGQGNMSAWSAAARVALVSDGADTRVATIVGLDNAGSPAPVIETISLNGLTEVLSVATFSKVFGVYLASTSGSRSVSVKQGTGGTLRGTIGTGKIICWLWLAAASKGAGLALADLAAAQSYGVWRQLTVSAGAGPVRPNSLTIRFEENS